MTEDTQTTLPGADGTTPTTDDGEPLARISPTLQTDLERARDYMERLIENRAPHRAEQDDALYTAIRDLEERISGRVTDEIAVGWEHVRIALKEDGFESHEVGKRFGEASLSFRNLWLYATDRTRNVNVNELDYRWNGGVVTLGRRTSTTQDAAVETPQSRAAI